MLPQLRFGCTQNTVLLLSIIVFTFGLTLFTEFVKTINRMNRFHIPLANNQRC